VSSARGQEEEEEEEEESLFKADAVNEEEVGSNALSGNTEAARRQGTSHAARRGRTAARN